jgi:uncharacterized membrane protein YkoI
MYRRLVIIVLLLSLASSASADETSDSARARAALERGEILALTQLLATVQARYEGRVIETELERRFDRWIYEFRFLPPTGRIFKVVVDAASGQVIGTHGPVQERH